MHTLPGEGGGRGTGIQREGGTQVLRERGICPQAERGAQIEAGAHR